MGFNLFELQNLPCISSLCRTIEMKSSKHKSMLIVLFVFSITEASQHRTLEQTQSLPLPASSCTR